MTPSTFEEAVAYRRSVRIYEAEKKLSTEEVKQCIEQATLAPNSSNLQLWEFYHVVSDEKKKALTHACLGQMAAKTAQELVVVVARKDLWQKRATANVQFLKSVFEQQEKRDPKKEKMTYGYYQKIIPTVYRDFLGILGFAKRVVATLKGISSPMYRQVLSRDTDIVAQKSAALAAQTFMLGMAAKGMDTCPMEGFDSVRVKKILGLPKAAMITMVISCGIRSEKGIYGPQFRLPFNEVYTKM